MAAMGSMGFRAFLALVALPGFLASENCDTVEMLQAQATLRAKPKGDDTVDEEEQKLLKDIAWTAAKTKYACKKSLPQCSALQQEYRQAIWPRIEKVLGHKLLVGKPRAALRAHHKGDPIYWRTSLKGCVGRQVILRQFTDDMRPSPGQNRPGEQIVAQLRSYSEANSLVQGTHGTLQHGFICNTEDDASVKTLVQDPLQRFYAAYDVAVAAKDSSVRARDFIEDYLQGAAGALRPQLEYFAPIRNCSVRFSFPVLKAEVAPFKEWRKLVRLLKCDEGEESLPYIGPKGESNTKDAQGTDASKNEFADDFFADDVFADEEIDLAQIQPTIPPSRAALQKVMLENEHAYLQAFCWFSIVDYVTFDYDMPEECSETAMALVWERALTWDANPRDILGPPKRAQNGNGAKKIQQHQKL